MTSSARNSNGCGMVKADCPRDLEVCDELELGRLLDRDVCRFGALEEWQLPTHASGSTLTRLMPGWDSRTFKTSSLPLSAKRT
jgi:hypothetical protein